MGAPKVTEVLRDAEESLEDTEFTGLIGKVVNPINSLVLLPATKVASAVVPGVVDAIPFPFLDEITALSLGFGVGVAKVGYTVFPHSVDPVLDAETERLAHQDFNDMYEKAKREKSNFLSSLKGVVGFGYNTVIDLARLPFYGDFGKWVDLTKQLVGYIVCTGIGGELLNGFFSLGAVDAMVTIAKVQDERNDSNYSRRMRTALSEVPASVGGPDSFKKIIQDSMKFARYASAAYGVSMIDSAKLLQVYGKKVEAPFIQDLSEEKRKKKTARYINVKPDDIIKMSDPGGDIDLLGHFIAVDRKATKTGGKPVVVLALRGTYTVSGLMSDLAGYTRPFCDGLAHKGIADRADGIWEHVKSDVVAALKANKGFDFVVTGHSLGAGAAGLLAIKLKHGDLLAKEDPSLASVKVSCFAYAPPPVYLSDESKEKINETYMENTYAFIHENDCVPFASADSVRRLSRNVDAVDEATNPIVGPLMAIGKWRVPQKVKDIIFDESEMPFIKGSEKLAIPALYSMWMRKHSSDDKGRPMYNAMFVRPQGYGSRPGTNDLNIFLDLDMIADHMNPMYERAISSIGQQMMGKNASHGYILPDM